jgi:hypothetical protein
VRRGEMGGCCSVHSSTTPQEFTKRHSPVARGGGGKASTSSPANPSSRSSSFSSSSLARVSVRLVGRAPPQIKKHAAVVTAVEDDALACAVMKATAAAVNAHEGEPLACWVALGALVQRSLVEAGGRQAGGLFVTYLSLELHRVACISSPGVQWRAVPILQLTS